MTTLSLRRSPRCALLCALGAALLLPLVAAATQTNSAGVVLSWQAPSENTDGSAMTNLAGFVIYFGRSPSAMTGRISVKTAGLLIYSIDDLEPGGWYFQVTAVNALGVESAPSTLLYKTI